MIKGNINDSFFFRIHEIIYEYEILDNIPFFLFTLCKNIKILEFNNNKLKNLKIFEHLDVSNITTLKFKNNPIEKIEYLNNFINLKSLYFNTTNINKIENLDSCINLEYLNCNMSKIRNIENIDNLKNLKKIFLSSSNLKFSKYPFEYFNKNKILIYIELDGKISNIEFIEEIYLENLKHIKEEKERDKILIENIDISFGY